MKIALLISGGGTTMEAIIKACQSEKLAGVIPVLIISSSSHAAGIEKAKKLGISEEDILVINPNKFESREKFGDEVIRECKKRNVDFIGQYGWHWLTPENIISKFEGRIVNQHPGPLDTGKPDFGGVGMYGLRVHQTRLSFVNKVNRDFWTEATAHRVTKEFDKGAILKRKQVPILPSDTAESLQERTLPVEHEVQIELLRNFRDNKVEEYKRDIPLVQGDEVAILEECKKLAVKMYPKG